MKNVFLVIFFASFFSCKGSGSEQSLQISQPMPYPVLISIGNFELDNESRTNLANAEVFNKYHFFGNNISELCSFLRIKTPLLFRTCKALLNYLPSDMANAIPFESKEELDQQLLFLCDFKLSVKRKFFLWQTLSDRYFNTYGGFITARNAYLKIEDPLVAAFHATIDFYKQKKPPIGFRRDLHKPHSHQELDQKKLDSFIKRLNCPDANYRFLARRYLDFEFLRNFEQISLILNANPTYQKISIKNQCIISYLLSALDINLRDGAFKTGGTGQFFETEQLQNKLIRLLKKVKKRMKKIQTDDKEEEARRTICYVVAQIFGNCFGCDQKQYLILLSKLALIDPYFLAQKFGHYSECGKISYYTLIKSVNYYCKNDEKKKNFINNFQCQTLPQFWFYPSPFYYTLFSDLITNNKFDPTKLNPIKRIFLYVQAGILALPSKYHLFAQSLFFGSLVLSFFAVIFLLCLVHIKYIPYGKIIS